MLSPRTPHGVATAMPAPLAVTTIVRQDVRPAARPAQAARPSGLAFADRFAGAPVWETSYAVRTESRASYAAAPTRSLQPAQAQRAIDDVASRAPTFQLASASSESIAVPSAPSVAVPAAPSVAAP